MVLLNLIPSLRLQSDQLDSLWAISLAPICTILKFEIYFKDYLKTFFSFVFEYNENKTVDPEIVDHSSNPIAQEAEAVG